MGGIQEKTGLVFDLPTDAQWEYACRAGTMTALNSGKELTNPLGRDVAMDEVGRYSENQKDGKGGYTTGHTKVGSYLPNDWGLYDMHGNVWEWCLDWWGANMSSMNAEEDPKGPTSGRNRVIRSGGWNNASKAASGCRSAFRESHHPSDSYYDFGFRVLCLPFY
jgi:formylglycine-generating enzyme required for sulfatase activity